MARKDPPPVVDIASALADMWELLTDEQRTLVMENTEVARYKKHQLIYAEGHTPRHFFFLVEGKVKIYREGVGGRNQIMRVIKPVEYFGYRAYFADGHFVTSAAAFESSVICAIPMEIITRMVEENNKLAMFFIKQLAIDLGIADERTVNLTQKHIRGRLAESLIFLKETYGLEEDGATISLLEVSLAAIYSACEGALFVAEEFGVYSTLRDCTAVNGYIFIMFAGRV